MIRFKLFGVAVSINFFFVATVTIFLLTDKTGISIIGLLACSMHELGHIIAFFALGYRPISLSFEMTGIKLVKPASIKNHCHEMIILISGSGINILMFLLFCGSVDKISTLSLFAVSHLLIGLFNLLPLKSFDGGKILEIILIRFFSIRTAYLICNAVDSVFILLMLGFCVWLIFKAVASITLLVMTIYLLVASIMRCLKGF